MRSSRQTELSRVGLPTHLSSAYFENSANIAKDHYLQIDDTDYANANKWFDNASEKSGAKSSAIKVQNAVLQVVVESCREQQDLTKVIATSDLKPIPATICKPTEWALRDSNPRPARCKHAALPTELSALIVNLCQYVLKVLT